MARVALANWMPPSSSHEDKKSDFAFPLGGCSPCAPQRVQHARCCQSTHAEGMPCLARLLPTLPRLGVCTLRSLYSSLFAIRHDRVLQVWSVACSVPKLLVDVAWRRWMRIVQSLNRALLSLPFCSWMGHGPL